MTAEWEARRRAWRAGCVSGPQGLLLPEQLHTAIRGAVGLHLSWMELCGLASTSCQCLAAAREALRRLRADVTRGCAGKRFAVRVIGRPASGPPFPVGFTYASRLRWGRSTTSGGSDVHAKLVVAWRLGWCLEAAESIESGARVCDYTGDVVRAVAARKRECRGEPTFVLSLVEHSLDESIPAWRTTVDATDHGGVARFVNHSCDPNIKLTPIRKTRADVIPTLAFVARRRIEAGEEVTLDYSGFSDNLEIGPPPAMFVLENSETRCLCGAANCRRWLPRHRDGLDITHSVDICKDAR